MGQRGGGFADGFVVLVVFVVFRDFMQFFRHFYTIWCVFFIEIFLIKG